VRVLHRLRRARKAPLAVAAILATPLFFVALMAFSLDHDKPSVRMTKKGAQVLGDPTKGTVSTIYLLSFGVFVGVVLAGLAALLLPRRVAMFLPGLAAIAAAVLLRLPLGTWETEHTARYPLGVDLIPKNDPGDLFLQGEWEENAHRTADQLGFWTIALSVAAMVISVAIEIRRGRRTASRPVPPPPPAPAATSHAP
jgi:hypothetical protein